MKKRELELVADSSTRRKLVPVKDNQVRFLKVSSVMEVGVAIPYILKQRIHIIKIKIIVTMSDY